AWITVYYMEDGELKEKIRPALQFRFLDTQRRDHVSARIYLDSYHRGKRTHALMHEMRMTMVVLQRSGVHPELVEQLQEVLGESPEKLQASIPALDEVEERFTPEPVESSDTLSARGGEEAGRPIPDSVGKADVSEEDAPSFGLKKWLAALRNAMAAFSGKISSLFRRSRKPRSAELQADAEREPADKIHIRRIDRPIWHWFALGGGIVLAVLLGLMIIQFVTDRDPELPAVSAPGTEMPASELTIQIAAKRTREGAVDLIRDLRSKGVDAYMVGDEGARWFRVRVGGFETQIQARRVADSLVAVDAIEEYYIARFEPGRVPPDVEQEE
ncbi:hypothetical protein GF324_01465, partial [bacterium]|nr:hypothetical protein [bacterium]